MKRLFGWIIKGLDWFDDKILRHRWYWFCIFCADHWPREREKGGFPKMKFWIEVFTDACLFWLPIDLLYLYYSGAWTDPSKVILYAELVLLSCLPLFAIWRIIQYIKES